MSRLQRQDVLDIIRDAFCKTVRVDYRCGHCISEEDVRCNLYRYVREEMAIDDTWRVFLNLTAKTSTPNESQSYKPDLLFFTFPSKEPKLAQLEILVEIKHWPSVDEIEGDLRKLLELRKIYEPDNPSLVFVSIMPKEFNPDKVRELQTDLKLKFGDGSDLSILLKPHLYCGPWDAEIGDPWRARLRHTS